MIFTASLATAQSNAQQYIENVIQRIDKAPGISAKFDIGSEHNNGIYMEGTLDMSGKKFRLETNNLTTWLPIKPAPPVINIVFITASII